MANDFDEFPVRDPITKKGDGMSEIWILAISTFYQTLISYLTQGGILLPRLTTAQRDALQNPQEGQLIYTTDTTIGPPRTASLQVWQVKSGMGAWYTITTT